ncbi:MAG: 50S ribosomal protein L3 [Bdellovibrionales bacterium]|nr:50S ribosomal protein L3 [Bdellovibrionales bacterium]
MSEETQTEETQTEVKVDDKKSTSDQGLKLNGLYAYKLGMSSVYDEEGNQIPVTVLKYNQFIVSQIKTVENDGYEAVQIASEPKKAVRSCGAEKGHLKKAGFENGAKVVKEIRQALPEGVQVGQKVSLESLEKGDLIKITSRSKGRGFSGVMKRHGFGGGPASHGSGTHRRPGSIGNCEFPGRVMPGRKMPGRFGFANVTQKNVKVVEVIPEENVLLVKGAIPGSKNTLVKLMKA